MKLTKAAALSILLFCFFTITAHAGTRHTVKGLVITKDGTVVPQFTITIKHLGSKPELLPRKHFKNGEFIIDGLTEDRYNLIISAPLYIRTKLEYDFKSDRRATDYSIVILHTYRNETRLLPNHTFTVSLKALQEKVPDAARDAYLRAVEFHRDGQLDQAAMEYGKAIRAYPGYVEALEDLGAIFILYNRPDSALMFLRRARDIDDCNLAINLNIAIALIEQGEYSEAMKILKKALSTNPRNPLAHYYAAKTYYLQKKNAQAEEHLRQATEVEPDYLEAWMLMISVSENQQKYDQTRNALMHIRDAVKNRKVSKFIDEQLQTLGS